ncbi:IclR family transcriptional regulator [Microbacterium sp. BWT-B31]|uniref:IclR family transcriptional regulator n=1 Tax=Microbacterium sp. BWT-B31 TaxID=3232072 RepID=UPI0035297743
MPLSARSTSEMRVPERGVEMATIRSLTAAVTSHPEENGARSLVERTLRVIGTFRERRVRQTLSEIARRADLNVATTFRIVGKLTAWGALERDEEGLYCIGLRLWEIASLAPRATRLEHISRPFIHDLYSVTNCSIHLAVRDENECVFIDRLHNPDQGHMRTRVGGRYPLHATAVGLVLLANAPEDVIEDIFAEGLAAYTDNTVTDPGELRRKLAEVRRTNVAIQDRTMNPNVRSIAAPISGPDGTVIAAISINARPSDYNDRSAAHIVRLSAASISRAIATASAAAPAAAAAAS